MQKSCEYHSEIKKDQHFTPSSTTPLKKIPLQHHSTICGCYVSTYAAYLRYWFPRSRANSKVAEN